MARLICFATSSFFDLVFLLRFAFALSTHLQYKTGQFFLIGLIYKKETCSKLNENSIFVITKKKCQFVFYALHDPDSEELITLGSMKTDTLIDSVMCLYSVFALTLKQIVSAWKTHKNFNGVCPFESAFWVSIVLHRKSIRLMKVTEKGVQGSRLAKEPIYAHPVRCPIDHMTMCLINYDTDYGRTLCHKSNQ